MDSRAAGMLVLLVGVAVVLIGLLVYTGALSWFGRLPGDIRYSSDSTRVYVPITSMIIVSVVISVASYLVRRFL
jgi:hypothetical protein